MAIRAAMYGSPLAVLGPAQVEADAPRQVKSGTRVELPLWLGEMLAIR